MPQSPYDKKKHNRPPKKTLDKRQIQEIVKMGNLGLSQEKMAFILGMHLNTLRQRMKENPEVQEAYERGVAEASYNVRATAYNMATSGKNFPATRFWLKCREKWSEVHKVELTGKDGEAIRIMTKDERDAAIKTAMKVLKETEDEVDE